MVLKHRKALQIAIVIRVTPSFKYGQGTKSSIAHLHALLNILGKLRSHTADVTTSHKPNPRSERA